MGMTTSQLRAVMKFHLRNFNDEGEAVTDDLVHARVLSATDGPGGANSKALYKGLMRRTLARNGHPDVRWPDEWLSLSVRDLAAALLHDSAADET